jgi:hypothetical protein
MKAFDMGLKELRSPLEKALSAYEAQIGVKFQDFPDIVLTPEKPNSARTVIPVMYNSEKVGDLTAIVFAREDGTGDTKTFGLNDLTISSRLTHHGKLERIIPRAKTGVISEGFFPFFSMTPQKKVVMFASCLDELSVDYPRIVRIWTLGLNKHNYSDALHKGTAIAPQVYATVGDSDGKRVGDPHAIYYNRKTEDALQVVGFLGIKDANSPLLNIAEKWTIPSK